MNAFEAFFRRYNDQSSAACASDAPGMLPVGHDWGKSCGIVVVCIVRVL